LNSVIFTETKLSGAYLIEPDRHEDERGSFETTFLKREFDVRGLDARVAQSAISFNRKRGTLRGLHYQVAPHEQSKLVRCTRGTIYDVIVDLRPDSPTYRSWLGLELSVARSQLVFVPPGFAHGFLTLEDDAELHYLLSEHYDAESERGVRWDDSSIGIRWPFPPVALSVRDRGLPTLGGE